MSNSQFYFLVGFYIYLNFFLSITIIKENFKVMMKIMALIFIWSIPLIGYFVVVLFLIINNDKLEKKRSNIARLITVVTVYSILFLMLGDYSG